MDDYFAGKRYVVQVESVSGFGRFSKYCLTIHLEGTGIVHGPGDTAGWYANNPERLRRKGQRIAARLNRGLDEHEARAAALEEAAEHRVLIRNAEWNKRQEARHAKWDAA